MRNQLNFDLYFTEDAVRPLTLKGLDFAERYLDRFLDQDLFLSPDEDEVVSFALESGLKISFQNVALRDKFLQKEFFS